MIQQSMALSPSLDLPYLDGGVGRVRDYKGCLSYSSVQSLVLLGPGCYSFNFVQLALHARIVDHSGMWTINYLKPGQLFVNGIDDVSVEQIRKEMETSLSLERNENRKQTFKK